MIKMKNNPHPIAIMGTAVPIRTKRSIYPKPYVSMMEGREKRQLGDIFGIKN